MKKLVLHDVVSDTYTNASGASLAMQILPYIKDNQIVEISFTGSSPMSSSFFNSSFGELIEKLGYDKVTKSIKIVGITAVQANLLRNYFDAYKSNLHH